jgi:hypothetical protein
MRWEWDSSVVVRLTCTWSASIGTHLRNLDCPESAEHQPDLFVRVSDSPEGCFVLRVHRDGVP